ncbi:MAG: 1-(5-phosphoribosyl)-5-[(5-phosphoribosylamino)methylideneamino]imidazole-4-carboxamide isomerase [Deinococcota bacterium]|nr:1-(5-phosphoribosyl)-5-[(5-phosphoribosylamino)methylideneamino]imidazole-4-carboxamide isomerase [Deinococcota bacterium]
MFEVIPCVDIQGGRAVRLFEGDPDKETVYFESPLEAAKHWAKGGCNWLHLVDLDAATGRGDNEDTVAEIARSVPCKVEVGGGIRDLATARRWLERVDRVVIGTAAITKPDMLDTLLLEYGPERLVVSIDAKEGRVAVKGWAELSEMAAVDLAGRVAQQGVRQVIYTDISRDGTLRGVNPAPVRELREAFPHTLIAGGGVASDADLALYEGLGLEGAIVGKALYEGRIRYPRTP